MDVITFDKLATEKRLKESKQPQQPKQKKKKSGGEPWNPKPTDDDDSDDDGEARCQPSIVHASLVTSFIRHHSIWSCIPIASD